METLTKPTDTRLRRFTETGTVYPILFMISITHLLNDMMQSVIPAVYPLLKEKFGFTFAQIGIITLVFQMTSSLLQPFIGLYADRHPRPYSLAAGMCFTLLGLFTLSVAPGFVPILLAVGLIGCGSSVFHPESSRVAQLASGINFASPSPQTAPRQPQRPRHTTWGNAKSASHWASWAYWYSRNTFTSPA